MPRQLRDAGRRDLGELRDRSRENLLQLQIPLFDESSSVLALIDISM